jgi:nucleotide-binding universal stress UspA family protein
MTSRRIVCATDFSRASLAAFRYALEAARRDDAELTILHVLPSPVPLDVTGQVSVRMYEEMEAAIRKLADRRMEQLLRRARRARVRARALLLEGPASEAIVRGARDIGARLIVIGTHGRSGLMRFLAGSVATRVVASARCPVVTVRSQ